MPARRVVPSRDGASWRARLERSLEGLAVAAVTAAVVAGLGLLAGVAQDVRSGEAPAPAGSIPVSVPGPVPLSILPGEGLSGGVAPAGVPAP